LVTIWPDEVLTEVSLGRGRSHELRNGSGFPLVVAEAGGEGTVVVVVIGVVVGVVVVGVAPQVGKGLVVVVGERYVVGDAMGVAPPVVVDGVCVESVVPGDVVVGSVVDGDPPPVLWGCDSVPWLDELPGLKTYDEPLAPMSW
jgi:hypothetical protein